MQRDLWGERISQRNKEKRMRDTEKEKGKEKRNRKAF